MHIIIKDILKKHRSQILLVILIIIISLITYYRVKMQLNLGPIWDTCDFLSNAFLFAGNNIGYSDLTRPPLLPFITSLFFKIGYVSEAVIFAVDGTLFIFGVIGLYLFLNLRFNAIQSFLGSLLFATFPIVLTFAGSGLTDIATVSFSIWAIYFTVLAVKNNSKFFYFVFPFLMLAFLMRYNSAITIFPIAFYILINRAFLKNLKEIIIGISGSFLLIIPVFIFFYIKFSNFIYPFLTFFNVTELPKSPENSAYNPNLLYFIEKLPSFIGADGIAILSIVILLGIIICGFKVTKIRSLSLTPLYKTFKLNEKSKKIKLVILAILVVIFIGTFGKATWMQSEVIFFFLCYITFEFLKDFELNNFDIDFLFLLWFMAYFIFHSVFIIKDNRYFVTMAPAVAYFLVLGLNEISNKLEFKIMDKKRISHIFYIILILMVLLSSSLYLPSIQQTNYGFKFLNENTASASEWLINYDPNYKTKIIYSDIWPYSGWYLKTDIKKMPVFKNNQILYSGVKNYNFTSQDNIAFNQELCNNNADYYFCIRQGLNLTSYRPIKQFGNLIIYKKID